MFATAAKPTISFGVRQRASDLVFIRPPRRTTGNNQGALVRSGKPPITNNQPPLLTRLSTGLQALLDAASEFLHPDKNDFSFINKPFQTETTEEPSAPQPIYVVAITPNAKNANPTIKSMAIWFDEKAKPANDARGKSVRFLTAHVTFDFSSHHDVPPELRTQKRTFDLPLAIYPARLANFVAPTKPFTAYADASKPEHNQAFRQLGQELNYKHLDEKVLDLIRSALEQSEAIALLGLDFSTNNSPKLLPKGT